MKTLYQKILKIKLANINLNFKKKMLRLSKIKALNQKMYNLYLMIYKTKTLNQQMFNIFHKLIIKISLKFYWNIKKNTKNNNWNLN